MKFIEVRKFGGPEVLQWVEGPDLTPGAGQILVEVKAAGVNFADIMSTQGHYPQFKSVPFRPGFEVAGIVSLVGEGVTDFKGGERVLAFVPSGGYASQVLIKPAEAIALPDSIDFGAATALLVQGMTAFFLLEAGQLSPGQSVLIASAGGGLGSLAIQMAKQMGAKQIIGLASPHKRDLVLALGATLAIDYTTPGWSKQVLEATGGEGVNVFLDSQGDLAGEGFDTLGNKSHWLIYGSQSGANNVLSSDRMWAMVGKNITLRGYMLNGDAPNFGRALSELIPWTASGELKIRVESFALADVSQAHSAISNRKTSGKVVLIP